MSEGKFYKSDDYFKFMDELREDYRQYNDIGKHKEGNSINMEFGMVSIAVFELVKLNRNIENLVAVSRGVHHTIKNNR